ncbi:hypothetical protein LSTR_LSTR007671 [Laodelphax striatellus]|uniref:C2H2-type domain-containing protein n=1 Tax=Laodelphax striatellus TaxID=195883 RepID=A0A482WJB8_LAOST|nr:hypothetical protein LSTR_LSTR007671 [Laodelphax striatellus]
MIPYMNVDLRSINLHYDQRMNWMLNNHQRITEERQQEKTNLSQKEKPQINMNQPMSMNELNSKSVSLGIQTDSDLVQSYDRSCKGQEEASGLFVGQAQCQAKEEEASAAAAAAIRSLRQASSNCMPMPTDYERNLIARLPIDENHLGVAQLSHPHHHHQLLPKSEPPPPYYGETDFDTNYYSKLMSAFLIQDCNQLRTFRDQAVQGGANAVLPNDPHPHETVADGNSKASGFDVRNAAYPLYNDAASLFCQHSGVVPGEGGKRASEGHTVNRKGNAIVRLGGEEVTCSVCDKKFPHMWLLKIHSSKHTGRRLRTCPLCSNAFVAAFGGSRRPPATRPSSTTPSPTPHHCDLCNRLFTPNDDDDDLHDDLHSYGGKVYTCDVCNRSYSTLGNLKQHKEKHYGEKNFVCEKCNKSFFTAGNLKQHLITHTGEKSFLCKLCNKTYSTSGNLRQHLLTHTGQKTNFCVICNRSFSTLGNLKQHMLTHFATNLYPCEVCKKSYSTLGNLKQHMLTHTGQKIFPCKKCDKTFTTLGNAKQHMIRHSGEKPYVCQTCSKSFFTLGNLKQHALTHSEEKHYKCDKCNKSFYTLSNLKQHSATHSDIKKTYVCEICSRSFSTFGNLKQHKLKHSLNISQVSA